MEQNNHHLLSQRFQKLLAMTEELPAVTTAVAYPCEHDALEGAFEATMAGLIVPVFIGPAREIEAVATAGGLNLSDFVVLDTPSPRAAAERAAAMARTGEVEAIMKGSLHTDDLMSAIVSSANGLRTERRISHVFWMDVPSCDHVFLITDAAINIEPSLEDKHDIVQNAIDLAHALGISLPKVALLSCTEFVNPRIRSTLDAAVLCKMADRGQITGGILDGPLAFDNALSRDAAQIKGIVSPVAGVADILVVPDLEAGNMLYKELVHLAGGMGAGIVMGARVPVILTSRSDSPLSRVASCALAQLMVHSKRGGRTG